MFAAVICAVCPIITPAPSLTIRSPLETIPVWVQDAQVTTAVATVPVMVILVVSAKPGVTPVVASKMPVALLVRRP